MSSDSTPDIPTVSPTADGASATDIAIGESPAEVSPGELADDGTVNDVSVASDVPDEETVKDMVAAAIFFAGFIAMSAEALPRAPQELRATMMRDLESTIAFGKDADTSARLALLCTIDTIVSEASRGTGIGELFARHFPDLGSKADLAIISAPRSDAFRAFARDWARCLWAGGLVDYTPHVTPALMRVMIECRRDGPLPPIGTGRRTAGPIWSPTPAQAAFAVAAASLVSRPHHAIQLVGALPKLIAVIETWKRGVRHRWVRCAEFVAAIGAAVSSDTVRAQWQEHCERRGKPIEIIDIM